MSGNISFRRHLWPINLPSISDQKNFTDFGTIKKFDKIFEWRMYFYWWGSTKGGCFRVLRKIFSFQSTRWLKRGSFLFFIFSLIRNLTKWATWEKIMDREKIAKNKTFADIQRHFLWHFETFCKIFDIFTQRDFVWKREKFKKFERKNI